MKGQTEKCWGMGRGEKGRESCSLCLNLPLVPYPVVFSYNLKSRALLSFTLRTEQEKHTYKKKTRATHANRLLTRVHGISPSTATWIKGIVSVLDNLVRFSTFDITFRVICTSIFIKSVSTETEVTILKTSVKESLRSTLVYAVLFRCISFNLVSKSSSIDKVKVVV